MDESIQQGKALVMAIQGLQALNDAEVKISLIESNIRPQLIKTYQRQLKAIIVQVPPEAAAEILMAMRNADLLTLDPGLN